MATRNPSFLDLDYSRYDFRDTVEYVYRTPKGLTREIVAEISAIKGEPEWMRDFRLRAYGIFIRKPMPTWGADLSGINFDEYTYYLRPTDRKGQTWDEVPEEIRRTFERLGIPEAERKFLAGVGAQYESEVVYHHIREDLAKKGVIFVDTDTAVREYPDLVRPYFGTVVPPEDNKFAALNSAVWSGGSFVYVPAGVRVDIPLQAYFRINAENVGQFERTLIIAEENSYVHYIEGCTAPIYSRDSLHSAVVEIIAKRGAHVRYTTIQNWSKNVYNLVTKRAVAYEDATVEWIDGNMGCVLAGELVYTEFGPQPIESVEPGTRVWSFDTQTRRWVLRPVLARKASGFQQVYEVVFSNGRSVRLTANHPLLSVHYEGSRPKKAGRYSLRWTPLAELSVGRYVVFPNELPENTNSVYYLLRPALPSRFISRNQYGAVYEIPSHARIPVRLPAMPDEDICWMLGLWLAEGDYVIANGSSHPRYGRVGWSVPRKDRTRKRLEALIGRYVGRNRIEERKDGVYFRVNSVEFALWLQANGFVSGAKRKRVPPWVFTLPRPLQMSFLAGYLDGDGYATRSHIIAKSAHRELLQDIQMLATQCGFHAGPIRTIQNVQDINGTGQWKAYTSYLLRLSQLEPLRPFLSEELRSRLKSAGRRHRYHQIGSMQASPGLLSETMGVTRIVDIRPSIVGPTYDLEVDGTSCFVVNGILVHNSKVTMKYPCVYLLGKGAKAEILSVAYAGAGQHQDSGAKVIHGAPYTTSTITSKSISKDGGRTTYRGLVKVPKGSVGVRVNVRCDALILDEKSRSDTYPYMEIEEERVTIAHEATVGKISDDQIFYLMSRGLTEAEALALIVLGFIEPFAKVLPMEYAIELNRLIQLEMEGAVG